VVVLKEHGDYIAHIAEANNTVRNIALRLGEDREIEGKIQMDYI